MNSFLRASRRALLGRMTAAAPAAAAAGRLPPPLVLVVGNESADLDSVACALVKAHVDQTTAAAETVVVPVINCPRRDFDLRTEVVYVFKRLQVDAEHLVFADELDVGRLASDAGLELVLVDHNKPTGSTCTLLNGRAPLSILDHHEDSGTAATNGRVIEPVGSCSSLVAREALKRGVQLEPTDAELLLAAILTDTINLDATKQRCTPVDRDMVEKLTALCGADRESLFRHVNQAKFDVSGLSMEQLLRKDYKDTTTAAGQRVGMASITLGLADVLSLDGAGPAAAEFCKAGDLDILVVMTVVTEPSFRRELAIFGRSPVLVQAVVAHLEKAELGLAPADLQTPAGWEAGQCALFEQGAANKSRKVVKPLLEAFATLT